jgi:acetyltransferase-like isoleucine patch superfamily enzyme
VIAAPRSAERPTRRQQVARVALVVLGLPKSLLFNLRYLPPRQALRLPFLLSPRVALLDLGGRVSIPPDARTGTVLLGFGQNGAFDFRRERSVWQLAGEVIFDGPARLGHGFKLSSSGVVRFGQNFVLQAESQIVCRRAITFGDGCLLSWDVLVLDTDFHQISHDGRDGDREAPVVIGDHVWVGARSTILKGVHLADGSVVAAGAVVVRSVEEPASLIGGHPAHVLRSQIGWRH